jgi:hypothetical protein
MGTVWYLIKVSDMIGLRNVREIDHLSVMRGVGAHGDQTCIGNRRRGMNDSIGGTGTIVGLIKGIVTRSATGGC